MNLATHLLNDGWRKRYELALVLSQDTDLVEPIRIVTQELGLKVGLIWLDGGRPSKHLVSVSSFVRHIRAVDLSASQFPDPILRAGKEPLSKPPTW